MSNVLAFTRNRKRLVVYNESEALHTGTDEAGRRIRGRALALHDTGRYDGADTAADVAISIVVPTCGRPELLNRCVASLVLQRFEPSRFEIIIVDDRPSGATRAVVDRWAKHAAGTGPDVVYLPNPGPHGPAAARNRGWNAARGDIIAFTDDDTIASPDWLEHGLRAFRDEDVDAVWGRIEMPFSGTPTDYERDAKNLETAEFVTANCFCRKKTMQSLGGFDERFRFAWREDSDFYFRLLDSQAHIVHAPKALITHPIRPAGWGVSLSQVKKIQFDALLFKKHPMRYREKIRATPRWDYYLIAGSLIAAAIALFAGALQPAVMAGALWLFLTGRFCAQRLRGASKKPAHVLEMVVTSALIPPVAVYWRIVGAVKFRVGLI